MTTASALTFTPVTKQDGLASWTSTAVKEGPGYLYSLHAPVADVRPSSPTLRLTSKRWRSPRTVGSRKAPPSFRRESRRSLSTRLPSRRW